MKEYSIEERTKICKECPIYEPSKQICNPRLYLNPETNEVSIHPKEGFIKGCGCAVLIKLKNPSAHCKLNKW